MVVVVVDVGVGEQTCLTQTEIPLSTLGCISRSQREHYLRTSLCSRWLLWLWLWLMQPFRSWEFLRRFQVT